MQVVLSGKLPPTINQLTNTVFKYKEKKAYSYSAMNNSFAHSSFAAVGQVAKARTNEIHNHKNAPLMNHSNGNRHSSHPIHNAFLQSIAYIGFQNITDFSWALVKILCKYFHTIVKLFETTDKKINATTKIIHYCL